jgi:hypothetical protein
VTARILDATHLELIQPLDGAPGDVIQIVVRESDKTAWREAARGHFLDAYADEDAVYDKL